MDGGKSILERWKEFCSKATCTDICFLFLENTLLSYRSFECVICSDVQQEEVSIRLSRINHKNALTL